MVRVLTGSGWTEALGINVSDTGMCLFMIASVPIDAQIQVEFAPPQCADRMRIFASVRHRALYLYGVEFHVNLDTGSADACGSQELSQLVPPLQRE